MQIPIANNMYQPLKITAMHRLITRFFVILLLISPLAIADDSFACPNGVLRGGESLAVVIKTCGEPLIRTRGTIEGTGKYGESVQYPGEEIEYEDVRMTFMKGKLFDVTNRNANYVRFYFKPERKSSGTK